MKTIGHKDQHHNVAGHINTVIVIAILDNHLSLSQEHTYKHMWVFTHGHWCFHFHLHLPGHLQTGRKAAGSSWGEAGH